jgi:hypothetical protein
VTSKDEGNNGRSGPAIVPAMGPASARRRIREVRSRLHAVMGRLRDALHGPWQRERQRIQAEFGAQGHMPLLMKARNGAGWTRDERIQLWHHLRQMASLSPYLIVLLAPGSWSCCPWSPGAWIGAACSGRWSK